MKNISTVSPSKRGLAAIVLSLSFLTAATSSFAGVIQYTDEAAFKSALGVFITHDFDAFVLDDGTLYGQPFEILDQQIPGIDFDNSMVFPGGSGGTYNSSPNVVLNEGPFPTGGPWNPIKFTFDSPVVGVGLFNSSLVDAERFEIYDVNDVLIASMNLPSVVVNFGGFISDIPIAWGQVVPISDADRTTNGSIFIDDLTVGAAAVPEPSVLLGFLTAGSLGLLFLRRRRG